MAEMFASLVEARGTVIADAHGIVAHCSTSDLAEAAALAINSYDRDHVLLAELVEALRPFAKLEVPKKRHYNAGAYSIRFDQIEAARAAITRANGGES